jgi:hypothetical protein
VAILMGWAGVSWVMLVGKVDLRGGWWSSCCRASRDGDEE